MAKHKRQRIEPYLQRLHGYAFSLTHDSDAARELLHEAVVKALAAKSTPRDDPAYRAWLFRILRNAFTDRYRKLRRVAESEIPSFEETETCDYGHETQQVNALAVRLAFGELPLAHREVLGAVDISGLTYAEAADLLEVPLGTIMSRISRARSALYKAMAKTKAGSTIEFLPVYRARRASAAND